MWRWGNEGILALELPRRDGGCLGKSIRQPGGSNLKLKAEFLLAT